ncbi:PQQ-binding-like beta-propeller repeat protein [Antrihabitans sp. NCIMB 15449]|uniref:PQQ-binding-like beta-propeller repeat protein n=1 Tax=Antrihabitans spumae TaxID=3373370 RepID=A0ABW7JSY3_9NOCA
MRVARSSLVALAAVTALVSVGCGADDTPSDIFAAGGWPGIHADARNSDTSTVEGSRSLSLSWSRPIGGPVAAYASIAANGQIFVTSKMDDGCNLFSFEMESGRKRFCSILGPGVIASTPIVDRETNIYVGDNGAVSSFNDHGQPRWRTPVVGTPISAQFTGDGNVLSVTQRGQVNVLERQTGLRVAPPFDLLPQPDPIQNPDLPVPLDDLGLQACFAGTAECPVANTPAIDLDTGRFFVTLWEPGAPVASLVALRYTGGDSPKVTREWKSDILPGGSATTPDLSADRSTVYVNDNENTLYAVDAATGATKWTYDLGFTPLGSQSTSDDGLIIPSGGEGGHLLALRDAGDRAELAWERTELVQAGVPAQAAGSTGYTVVRKGDGPDAELALLTFDTTTGETLDEDTLPNAKGFTVGTSIGPKGEVLTPTLLGELFVFESDSD